MRSEAIFGPAHVDLKQALSYQISVYIKSTDSRSGDMIWLEIEWKDTPPYIFQYEIVPQEVEMLCGILL